MSNDTRYPYTHAADYIRAVAGYNESGTKLSRGDASRICGAIADVMAIPKEQIAMKLADHYLANRKEIETTSVNEFNQILITKYGINAAEKKFGCHCDLEEGMIPDECVIDQDRRDDCVYAGRIADKDECEYWKEIK